MKKTVLFFALTLPAAIISAQQDTIANPGFEMWDVHPSGYDVAGSWRTLNPLTSIVGTITAYKTSDPAEVHSGSHAIKLVTKTAAGQTAPALVTTGQINNNGIYGGVPINSRPQRVTGWYRYFPVGSDNAIFEISLRRQGVEIGSGSFTPSDSVSDWTPFEFTVNYTSTETPDTVTLTFFASNGNGPNAAVNSTLFIDDVAYDYTTGIFDIGNESALKIVPNPASDRITVEIQNTNIESIIIYSIEGRKVKEVVAANLKEVQVDDLMPGKYVLSAHPAQGKPVSKVFEIQ